ncbi:MAG: hypothetical protein JW751_13610, partial [Polyangiaceae bacterium]|nr:hypothetical protein [Polyangiaceae bacterium]
RRVQRPCDRVRSPHLAAPARVRRSTRLRSDSRRGLRPAARDRRRTLTQPTPRRHRANPLRLPRTASELRLGARDYDPTTGRWTGKDPIRWHGGGTNLFVYANGDAINYADPNGRVAIAVAPYIVATAFAVMATGYTIWWVQNRDNIDDLMDDLADRFCTPRPAPPPPQSDDEGCDKEWRDAYEKCADWITQKPSDNTRGLTGGYRNIEDCARGHVSARCGGNPV